MNGAGVLDYVTGWYRIAADYLHGQKGRAAFVSTSSITQGEQPGVLFPVLFQKGMTIQFGHRTFPWASESRGKANVHVVIIGFGPQSNIDRKIYDYDASGGGEAGLVTAGVVNIAPYLVPGGDFALPKRRQPLCAVSPMSYGNMPNDGGFLLLSDEEKRVLLRDYPGAAPFVRPFVGPDEFLYSVNRWCLWLDQATPAQLRAIPPIEDRVRAVKKARDDRRVFYALQFFTGTRFGEAAGLRWFDLEHEHEPLAMLSVERQYADQPLKGKRNEPGVPRTVPVHPQLATILAEWKLSGFPLMLMRHTKPEDFIVPSRTGACRSLRHMGRKLCEDLERLKLAKTEQTHAFRRGFKTIAVANGAHEVWIERIIHNASGGVADGYLADDLPAMCRAVSCIPIERPVIAPVIPLRVGAQTART